MRKYTGLPEELRVRVLTRDNYRCRWCGATNQGGDLHHIRYRRGFSDDVEENLITLCRAHHSFVHGTPNGAGDMLGKRVAQLVLNFLVEHPGTTGSAVWRRMKRQWLIDGRCEQHGEPRQECVDCRLDSRLSVSDDLPLICEECGNDEVCEGYRYCSECLEENNNYEEIRS